MCIRDRHTGEPQSSMIPPWLKPGSHTGRDKFDGTRKTPRAPEKGRRACRKNGAMLHRGRLGVGRTSVAHNPRPAETTQRPLGTLRSYEHSNDLPQVARLRCCGDGVASSGLVLQAHGSGVLLRLATRLSA